MGDIFVALLGQPGLCPLSLNLRFPNLSFSATRMASDFSRMASQLSIFACMATQRDRADWIDGVFSESHGPLLAI